MDLIIFIIALSILVLVHEFGHYLMAVKNGIKVEEFGLGLPPRIWGKKIGDTIWSLNWLPIGGFCKLYGEDGGAKGNRAFNNKKPWQKMLVVLGGVMMNMILAILVFSVVYSIVGVPQDTDKVKITDVVTNSPADKVGLRADDWVVEVEGKTVTKPQELTEEVAKYKGRIVNLLIEQKNGQRHMSAVEVRENPPKGEGAMGVAISNTEMVKIKWYEFYKGIWAGLREAYFWGKIIGGGVLGMIGGLLSGKVPADVSGPIGMYQATSSIKASQGMLALIHFFAVVSVNLAVVNVLPFPALDGGRIIFVLYEMITKKKANQRFEGTVNMVGMMVLLGLILLITVGDVMRIVRR